MLGIRRHPALTAWRTELAAARRTEFTFDPLWRAACAEAWAAEFETTFSSIVAGYRREAERIIRAAAEGRAA